MKTYAIRKGEGKLGYELAICDNGKVTTIDLIRKTTDNYLYMPDEVVKDTNRKLISMAMVDKALETNDEFEIIAKSVSAKTASAPKTSKSWINYLTDDEKALIEELKARATTRMNDPIAKAKKALEAAQKAYDELVKKAEAAE